MAKKIKSELTESAKNDLIQDAIWYETQKEGLGIEYFNDFKLIRNKIEENPKTSPRPV